MVCDVMGWCAQQRLSFLQQGRGTRRAAQLHWDEQCLVCWVLLECCGISGQKDGLLEGI